MDRAERIRAERAASPTTPLTDEALAEIEAGLEGVTEGPWYVDQRGYRRSTPTIMAGGYYVWTTGPYEVRNEPRGQTANHIARLNPVTVAAWLARDKALRARIAGLERNLAIVLQRESETLARHDQKFNRFEARIAELEAENKRLEAELDADREHSHAGAVNALAGKIGDMQLVVSPDLHWRDKEEK